MSDPSNQSCFRRVLLVQAPLGRQEPLVYPLGLAVLAGCVDPTNTVRIVDPNLIGIEQEERETCEFQPDIIGISIRNIDSQMRRDLFYYYLHFKEHIKRIRKVAPDVPIIVGGPGFSLFPERIMNENPDVDFGVFLEGEISFPMLLSNPDQPDKVKGIFYRKNGGVEYSGNYILPSADDIPYPRFDLLDPRPYVPGGGVGVQTKRGCPLKCAYCTYPHLNGTRFRMRPVKKVLFELETLVEKGVREITFVDGIFNLPRDRAVEILESIKSHKLKIRWRGWFIERGFDRQFAMLCRETGCSEFSFSPDGYSSRTLKALGKTISVGDIHAIYDLAKELEDIRIAFNFFWNPPDQTILSFLRMIWFLVKCKVILRSKVGGIIFGNPRIEPNTPLWQRAVDDGIIDSSTNLLPSDIHSLEKTFYSNPSTKYLDSLFLIYVLLWKMKSKLKQKNESRKK